MYTQSPCLFERSGCQAEIGRGPWYPTPSDRQRPTSSPPTPSPIPQPRSPTPSPTPHPHPPPPPPPHPPSPPPPHPPFPPTPSPPIPTHPTTHHHPHPPTTHTHPQTLRPTPTPTPGKLAYRPLVSGDGPLRWNCMALHVLAHYSLGRRKMGMCMVVEALPVPAVGRIRHISRSNIALCG